MNALQLLESEHPSDNAAKTFEALVGIDPIKEALVDELSIILDRQRFQKWLKRHHPDGLGFAQRTTTKAPLILLSGEVGCGKTELASCVATPVARTIGERILCMESPSDIRGGGHVGEISLRITEAFAQAKSKAAGLGRGILIIDEADDVATMRSQMQAHHEDRAGVNVLIKQIDQLAKSKVPIAVVMITNRADVLDPTVARRAVLALHFERPDKHARQAVFRQMLEGTKHKQADIDELVAMTERSIPYTFSDLTDRIGRLALRHSWKKDMSFGLAALKDAISEVQPTPLIEPIRK